MTAFSSVYVTVSEEELSLPLPWPHVQRRADGEASFSPENSNWVRTMRRSGSAAEVSVAAQFELFLPPSDQLLSRIWLPYLRPRGGDLFRRRSPK